MLWVNPLTRTSHTWDDDKNKKIESKSESRSSGIIPSRAISLFTYHIDKLFTADPSQMTSNIIHTINPIATKVKGQSRCRSIYNMFKVHLSRTEVIPWQCNRRYRWLLEEDRDEQVESNSHKRYGHSTSLLALQLLHPIPFQPCLLRRSTDFYKENNLYSYYTTST